MKLNQLLERLDYQVVQGSDSIEITTLINDSRKVEAGSVFVCISGAVSDGHQYIPDVAAKGAAAVVVMSEEKAKELGVKPMATWVAGALAGVEPRIMGIGPVAATRKVLEKTGMSIGDFDIIEANEAFAAQSVAVGKELGFDLSKLNPNGGAIALGHPVGASGCRILVTLLHEMEKKDAKTGLATLCIGGGMGCAAVVKRD